MSRSGTTDQLNCSYTCTLIYRGASIGCPIPNFIQLASYYTIQIECMNFTLNRNYVKNIYFIWHELLTRSGGLFYGCTSFCSDLICCVNKFSKNNKIYFPSTFDNMQHVNVCKQMNPNSNSLCQSQYLQILLNLYHV